jgi:hypothetical protein
MSLQLFSGSILSDTSKLDCLFTKFQTFLFVCLFVLFVCLFVCFVCLLDRTTLAMISDLTMQLQLDPSIPKVEEILAMFPLACNMSDCTLFTETLACDLHYQKCYSAMQDHSNMDQLSKLIMSVIMDLE